MVCTSPVRSLSAKVFAAADGHRNETLVQDLRRLLAELELSAPLGVFAVRGNVDGEGWPDSFSDLPITVFKQTRTLEVGEFVVTGLSLKDSFDPHFRIADDPRFHIVFGHSPDFALGDVKADLLIAGHTHGGQVRLPLIAPSRGVTWNRPTACRGRSQR